MSRALDHEDATSVKSGNPQSVYNDIVAALYSASSGLLEIELLGKSHPLPSGCNLLIDGNSIAIPKVKLVQAFFFARQVFFQHQRDFHDESHQDLQDASAVMLLMDPEHLTAANIRKRLIQRYQGRSTAKLEVALTAELVFVDSMLTSPLHRHTKSPTLWSHRRWLIELCQSIDMPRDLGRDLAAVVLVAAERHPRNYYAWSHLRWLVHNTGGTTKSSGMSQESVIQADSSDSCFLYVVRDWCIRRPGDTSGWSFLLFCLLSLNAPDDLPHIHGIETNSAICGEVLGLATSFNWSHESVWVFLRTLVASGKVRDNQRASFLKAIQARIAAQTEGSWARSNLQSTLDWYTEYQKEIYTDDRG